MVEIINVKVQKIGKNNIDEEILCKCFSKLSSLRKLMARKSLKISNLGIFSNIYKSLA